MPTDAAGWAEWAAKKFIKGCCWIVQNGVLYVQDPKPFNPLEDLNHLGLVLDEIERRGRKWTLDTMCSLKEYTMAIYSKDGGEDIDSGPWPAINLAVLRAAYALQEKEKP